MSMPAVVRPSPAPPLHPAQQFVLRVCTANPFYVISAGLFLAGLYASFGAQAGDVETWALMSGLAGYTLLLAVTAFLLVRFAGAWDDLRTVLLLVALMFLATSVTFDEVLVLDRRRGIACYLVGLAFAVVVSEGLLRGIRLRLPAGFRLPYYLILALFFLYPLALSPLVDADHLALPAAPGPRGEALMWALFAFAPVAGLVFLTLLPAIRRGPGYVADNGSPWGWPLYPWTLFGLFAGAVPARGYLLCYSMHLVGGADRGHLIFGPYFIVPFGLALAVLLLEIGLVGRYGRVLHAALAVPVGLAVLAMVGHRHDAVYREFLGLFTERLGGTPLFLTLLASAALYLYAMLRRVPLAAGWLTAALVALSIVGPGTLDLGELIGPQPLPLLLAAALQLALGVVRRSAWHSLLGGVGLAVAVTLALPDGTGVGPWRGPIGFHLALASVFILGAAFRDERGQSLRTLAGFLVFLACLAVSARALAPVSLPVWWAAYPPLMALLLAGYGWLLGDRPSCFFAALAAVSWVVVAGWRVYLGLRQLIAGLDAMALGLAAFALAVLISLGKSGSLLRWAVARGWTPGPDAGPGSAAAMLESPPPSTPLGEPPPMG